MPQDVAPTCFDDFYSCHECWSLHQSINLGEFMPLKMHTSYDCTESRTMQFVQSGWGAQCGGSSPQKASNQKFARSPPAGAISDHLATQKYPEHNSTPSLNTTCRSRRVVDSGQTWPG
jgi:hypothetical protein